MGRYASRPPQFYSVNHAIDAKIFYRLEKWILDSDDLSRTVYLKRMGIYQRNVARLTYRSSGGNEERALHLFVSASGGRDSIALLRRSGRDEEIMPEFARKIHTAYFDALYAFLDGLVHVAFSDQMLLLDTTEVLSPVTRASSRNIEPSDQARKAEELNFDDRVRHASII